MRENDRHDLATLELLRVVRQRWWIVAIVLCITLGMALRQASTGDPRFSATATVEITEAQKEWIFGVVGVSSVDPVRLLETERYKVSSTAVWEGVESRLGTAPTAQISSLTVEIVGNADLLEITVEAADPDSAVRGAGAFADSYIEFRVNQTAATLETLGESLRSRSTSYYEQLADVESRIRATAAPGDEIGNELARLLVERDALLSLATESEKRADEVILEASVRTSGPTLLGEAGNVQGPLQTSVLQALVLAAVVGLAAGAVLALLVDYLDDRIRSGNTTEPEFADVPVLGATPDDRDLSRVDGATATISRPMSGTADAYRAIRAALLARAETTPIQTILVTSPDAGDGKTTVVSELAVVLARSGRDVVVIDANLRNPQLHDRFRIGQVPGLASVLAGDRAMSMALVTVPLDGAAGRLRVLPAGPLLHDVTEVLDGQRTIEVLRTVQADADLVLIDAPDVLGSADAHVLAGMVDGVILVARKGRTKERRLAAALSAITSAGVPAVWTVLNGFATQDLATGRRNTGRRSSYRARPTPARTDLVR